MVARIGQSQTMVEVGTFSIQSMSFQVSEMASESSKMGHSRQCVQLTQGYLWGLEAKLYSFSSVQVCYLDLESARAHERAYREKNLGNIQC